MMLKAVLAWAGIMAARSPIVPPKHVPNKDVHDAFDREQALFSGSQVLVRKSDNLAQVMASEPGNTVRINKGLDDMRNVLAEVARRADR